MALTTAEVTAVSRNSGTSRIREDTQGHDKGANQVQEDTGGAAGILKDTSPPRFGTVRPRVQISGPRPISEFRFALGALNSARTAGPHGFQPCAIDLEGASDGREM